MSARLIRSDPDSDPTLSGAVVVVESSSDSASVTAASATAASVVVGSEASVGAATSSSYLNRYKVFNIENFVLNFEQNVRNNSQIDIFVRILIFWYYTQNIILLLGVITLYIELTSILIEKVVKTVFW